MLHAAKLQRRNEHEIELAPGIRDAGVLFEPGEGARMEIEDGVAVADHLGGIGLAMKHAERAAIALSGFDAELSSGEGEQVSGERLGFGKMDGPARARHLRSIRDCLPT